MEVGVIDVLVVFCADDIGVVDEAVDTAVEVVLVTLEDFAAPTPISRPLSSPLTRPPLAELAASNKRKKMLDSCVEMRIVMTGMWDLKEREVGSGLRKQEGNGRVACDATIREDQEQDGVTVVVVVVAVGLVYFAGVSAAAAAAAAACTERAIFSRSRR